MTLKVALYPLRIFCLQDTMEDEHAIQTHLFVYTTFHSRKISQETSLQMYTHIYSLEVRMVEIFTDLNW